MSGTSVTVHDLPRYVVQGTPANETLQNASSGFADSMGLSPVVLFVLYAVVALAAAQYAAPWLVESDLLSGIGMGIVQTIVYAMKGMTASVVLAVAAAPFYFVATADAGARETALEVVGYGIAAILVLAGIGWLADRAVAAFIDAHPDYDEWGDLFPEEEPDAVADGGERDE